MKSAKSEFDTFEPCAKRRRLSALDAIETEQAGEKEESMADLDAADLVNGNHVVPGSAEPGSDVEYRNAKVCCCFIIFVLLYN